MFRRQAYSTVSKGGVGRLLTLSVLSLLALSLVGGAAWGWIESARGGRAADVKSGLRTYSLSCVDGGIVLAMDLDASPSQLEMSRFEKAGFLWLVVTDHGWSATDESRGSAGHGLMALRIGMPFWPLILLGLVLVGATARGWRNWWRSRLAAAGCCVACGYDLRASGGACPECGVARSTC